MRRINILDLNTDTWHSQSATGEYIPESRMHACVAVQSTPDNSSHNIYMFGGGSGSDMFVLKDETVYQDLWILSLPSFRWTRKTFTSADDAPVGRQQHSCHTVGRNMVVIGGTYNQTSNCTWDEISVLDMTTLQWLTTYTYNSNTYQLPDPVSAAIVTNGKVLADPNNGWEDPQLEALFKGTTVSIPDHDHPINYGSIGGAVAAGVVLTAIFAIGICLFRRRRRNQRGQQLKPQPPPPGEFVHIVNFDKSGFASTPGASQYGDSQFSSNTYYAHGVDGRSTLLGLEPGFPQYAQRQPSPVSASTPGFFNPHDHSGDLSRVPLVSDVEQPGQVQYAELPPQHGRNTLATPRRQHQAPPSPRFELGSSWFGIEISFLEFDKSVWLYIFYVFISRFSGLFLALASSDLCLRYVLDLPCFLDM